ncbi:hypothetical protein, partial [Frankia sp. B2]|uniref:hypothetical protein n=1 Tax=Frankia sp. B2 TaxID=2541730 RepID=UPI00197AB4D1
RPTRATTARLPTLVAPPAGTHRSRPTRATTARLPTLVAPPAGTHRSRPTRATTARLPTGKKTRSVPRSGR